jgi:hypothetical protein
MSRKSIILLKLVFLLFIPYFSSAQPENNDSTYTDSSYIYISEDEYYNDEEYYAEKDESERDFSRMGDISFSAAFPFLQNKRKFKHKPLGFDLAYSMQIKDGTPIYGLLGLNYSFYGSEAYTYYNATTIEGYGEEWEESFLTHFFTLYTGGRYFSKRSYSIFNPYCQLDLRFRYLFGMISTKNIEYGETVDSKSKGGNSSLGYGITLGSLTDINSNNVFFNFSFTFDGGGGMKYFNRKGNPGEIYFVTDYFDYNYLPNSFLTFKIGLIFY